MHPQKSALRLQMRQILRSRSAEYAARSLGIRERILAHPDWVAAGTVALFCPMECEVELLELLPVAGKRAIFPAVAESRLEWREVKGVSEFTRSERFPDLREPSGGAVVSLAEADLVVVPGLAFTRCGKRLGRGGGFYDRALADLPKTVKRLGICFEFQVVEDLPTESHDAPLDGLLFG
jgi:5-formyltetrahydrofolate cyclo-ligase